MSFIYMVIYDDGTGYVGQTTGTREQLVARYRGYATKAEARRPSEKAVFALGMPAIGVLEYCPPEKLNERETYWIEHYHQMGKLHNVMLFGTSGREARQRATEADALRRMKSKLRKKAQRDWPNG